MAEALQERLKAVLEDEELCLVFEEFLVKRYAWENIGFWFDVEEYKTINIPDDRKKFAKLIYDKYLDPSSPFELGDVDPEMRELIFNCLNNPPPKIFNIIQHKIFLLLAHSNIHAFYSDESYKLYLESKNEPQRKINRKNGNASGYDYLHKMIMLGDLEAGKSSLLAQYIRKDHTFKVMQGVEFETKSYKANTGRKIKFQIWDTAGQERYNAVTSAYYRGAAAAVIVYDITNRESFNNLLGWLNRVREIAPDSVVILLLGNKLDKQNQRKVSTEEGKDFAEQNSLLFMEVSAVSAQNLDEAFDTLMSEVYAATRYGDEPDSETESVQLGEEEEVKDSNCKC